MGLLIGPSGIRVLVVAWAALIALAIGPAAASAAPPPGIYTVSELDILGRPIVQYSNLNGDGSIVRGLLAPNQIWTYPTGAGPMYPTSYAGPSTVWDATPDLSSVLGRSRQVTGWVIARRDGSGEIPLASLLSGQVPISPSWLSPNAQYATGASTVGRPPFTNREVARWSASGSAQVLPRDPDFDANVAVAVTDDGIVYGNGLKDQTSSGVWSWPSQSAVRWNAAGQSERLAGIDADGHAWKLSELVQIGSGGAKWLGYGSVERPAASGVGVENVAVVGVFDASGVEFVLSERLPGQSGTDPYLLGMSADASVVYGHRRITSQFTTLDDPRIWTRETGEVSFRGYLESMGLDTSRWTLGSILDISDDGRAFLAYGTEIGGRGYQVLVVVPEPDTTLLLGSGLIALACVRTRKKLAGMQCVLSDRQRDREQRA